jgi:hypothetical protein
VFAIFRVDPPQDLARVADRGAETIRAGRDAEIGHASIRPNVRVKAPLRIGSPDDLASLVDSPRVAVCAAEGAEIPQPAALP